MLRCFKCSFMYLHMSGVIFCAISLRRINTGAVPDLNKPNCYCFLLVSKIVSVPTRGSERDVVYLGGPIAPCYMSPNAGGGGGCGCQIMSTAAHMVPKYTLEIYLHI